MAQEILNDMEEESVNLLSGKPMPSSMAPSSLDGKTETARAPQQQPQPKKTQKPAVVASKVRKNTLKAYTSGSTAAKQAMEQGNSTMAHAEHEFGSLAQALQADVSIKVLNHRMSCLKLLLSDDHTKASEQRSQLILDRLNKDEFFQDQQWDPKHIHTLGNMVYLRNTMMDLQRTAEAVEELGEIHKESLNVLSVVSQAVSKEAKQWESNVVAMRKARDLEEKALQKEAERQRKQAERKAKQEQDKLAKLAAKAAADAAKAAAEAAKATGEDHDPIPDKPKPKRRRKAAADAQLGWEIALLVILALLLFECSFLLTLKTF